MSELQQALEEYLAVRRACGFELRSDGILLPHFVRFVQEQGARSITIDLALRWAKQPAHVQPAQWANRLGMVRRFATYRSTSDPCTEIPPKGLLPHSYRRKEPYIYSDQDIERILQEAQKLPSKTGLRAATYTTFLGLLTVTGLRMSEAIQLDGEDVDLHQGLLTIRRAKFGKSRFVPLHGSTREVLQTYQEQCRQIYPHPGTPSFFLSEQGRRLGASTVRSTFADLSRHAGLRGPEDRHGPRLHDLRHRFAVQTILKWYQAGADVQTELPKLATYLGHTHVYHTYWYITAIPELLHCASLRRDPLELGP
jgi:site-specific recombinase XerD